MILERESLTGYQRIDSRGKPTVKARLEITNKGRVMVGEALVPSGASTGKLEARELRDGDRPYLGFGVTKAVENIGEIGRALEGMSIFDQDGVDRRMRELDGTPNKERLGANAILAVSLAFARAAAEYRQMPLFIYLAEMYGEPNPTLLPTPMMNVINGGAHAKNGLDFQEFMVVPVGVGTFGNAMRVGTEAYGHLGKIVEAFGVGDEGGFSPTGFKSETGTERAEETLALLTDAIEKAGYKPGEQVAIALDPAASEFFREEQYQLAGRQSLSPQEMVNFYQHLVKTYPIISIEDGMAEGDENGWQLQTEVLGGEIQLVGDDVFVTNSKIFEDGIKRGIANAILVKLNQIGTLSETLAVIKMAQTSGYGVIISHRSGETEDTFIADLAVATRAGQIKTGAPARGERTAKYNRLLDIEEIELPKRGLAPEYAGVIPFAQLRR